MPGCTRPFGFVSLNINSWIRYLVRNMLHPVCAHKLRRQPKLIPHPALSCGQGERTSGTNHHESMTRKLVPSAGLCCCALRKLRKLRKAALAVRKNGCVRLADISDNKTRAVGKKCARLLAASTKLRDQRLAELADFYWIKEREATTRPQLRRSCSLGVRVSGRRGCGGCALTS
jgi:hypothetical protein